EGQTPANRRLRIGHQVGVAHAQHPPLAESLLGSVACTNCSEPVVVCLLLTLDQWMVRNDVEGHHRPDDGANVTDDMDEPGLRKELLQPEYGERILGRAIDPACLAVIV